MQSDDLRLSDLQWRFQSFVLEGKADITDDVAATERVPAAVRLAIYGNAYNARLVQALADNYPTLSGLLGPEPFRQLAQAYMRRHPPEHFSIRWYGAHLSAFLAGASPYSQHPALGELARWEWSLTLAFDAADNPILQRAAFTPLTPGQWPGLRLALHPSVSVLSMATEAPLIWRALDRGEPLPEEPPAREQPQHWVIWRKDLEIRYRPLDAVEAAALQAVARGDSFGEVCEAVAKHALQDTAAATAALLLARWLEDEMLAATLPV